LHSQRQQSQRPILSGLAFGFFASLLAMTVGVEVRIKNPPLIANSHYLIRRGVLISLYVISMFLPRLLWV